MRDYSKVSPKFWIGETGRQLRKQGVEALVVGMYLMTSPHSNMLGLYYQPLMLIAHETGLGLEGASKGLRGAIEAGFCVYDEVSEMVWVHEMAAFQIAEQLAAKDNQCKGIQNEYNKLPMNPFLPAFYERYAHAFHLTAKRGERRVEPRAPNPLASPLQAPPKPGTGAGTGAGAGDSATDVAAAGAAGTPPPPAPGTKAPADPDKLEVWNTAKALCLGAGMQESKARSAIGKLVADYGIPAMLETVRVAQKDAPLDPIAFMTATCQRIAGERRTPNKQEKLENTNKAIADELAAEMGLDQ